MNKFLLLIAILVLSTNVYGQKKGYVVTNDYDTIHGLIHDRGGIQNSKVCWFRQSKKGDIRVYRPDDIKEYRLEGDEYYVSKQIMTKGNAKRVFVEVLIKGKANLYEYAKDKKTNYYIEKEGQNLVGLTKEKLSEFYQPEINTPVSYSPYYTLTNWAYLDSLSSVFRDGKNVQKDIRTVTYDRKPLMSITKQYLREVCKGNNCLTYEKDFHRIKPRVGLYTGFQMSQINYLPGVFNAQMKSGIHTSFPVGGFINIPLPRLSDKLSFQLELLPQFINYKDSFPRNQNFESISMQAKALGIPLLLKYELGQGKIVPFVSLGKQLMYVYKSRVNMLENVNLIVHPWPKRGFFAEAGANYPVGSKITFFANLRFQIERNLIVLETRKFAPYNKIVQSENYITEFNTNSATLYVGIKF